MRVGSDDREGAEMKYGVVEFLIGVVIVIWVCSWLESKAGE